MSAKDPYFQFPISLLAFGRTEDERLEHIVSYCLVDAGSKLTTNLIDGAISGEQGLAIEETIKETAEAYLEKHHLAALADEEEGGLPSGGATVFAAGKLGVKIASLRDTDAKHSAAAKFAVEQETLRGTASPSVRIRTNYLWEARKGTGVTYREFAVLCAVYSVIGDKKGPVRITRDAIRARVLGYPSAKSLFDADGEVTTEGAALLARRADKQRPLTTDQVRYTLDGLEERNFFSRVSIGREAHFSNRQTADAMRSALVSLAGIEAEAGAKIKRARQKDRAAQAAIRGLRL